MSKQTSSDSGQLHPALLSELPGPRSRDALTELARWSAPMGPRPSSRPPPLVVYGKGIGCNVYDVDGNRFVDMAAGFGSLLLGHCPREITDASRRQLETLCQAMGDVHPSHVKVQLLKEVAQLFPGEDEAQCILGQSGADALTAAMKTATLATGRRKFLAYDGAYHGLSFAPLAVCGLRSGYRDPFAQQLAETEFVPYPRDSREAESSLEQLERALRKQDVAAVVFEPIAGRAGCYVPPDGHWKRVLAMARAHGTLCVADEVWTGLGRSGAWLRSEALGLDPDIVCLGKGLGGGLPISACVGAKPVMQHWSQSDEVVHTSTFAGAPLAAAAALALLRELRRGGWIARSEQTGNRLREQLSDCLERARAEGEVRGAGLMIGVELPGVDMGALQACLLRAGYITSLGGGSRETLILTPPLNVSASLCDSFVAALQESLQAEWVRS